MPTLAGMRMLQLSREHASRVLQWFPFQTRNIDLDQILATRLDQALSGALPRVALTRGECSIVTRWYRNLIPALIQEVDSRLNDRIERFLSRQLGSGAVSDSRV